MVTTDGAKVCRRQNRLVVWSPDGELLASVPAFQVTRVLMAGSVKVTSPTLMFLLRQGVPVSFIDGLGRPVGTLIPHQDQSVFAQMRQLQAVQDPDICLDLSRRIVVGKIHNQAALLSRRAHWADSRTLRSSARSLRVRAEKAGKAETVDEARGHEGAAAALYFRALLPLLAVGGYEHRDRAGNDVSNALINYCSGILREQVRGAILSAGLHPGLGFLHDAGPARPSLAFDLMEEWRPILVEGVVASLLGLKRIQPADLELRFGRRQLTSDARHRTVERFHRKLSAVAPSSDRSLGEILHGQPRALSHHLSGGPTYQPFQWT